MSPDDEQEEEVVPPPAPAEKKPTSRWGLIVGFCLGFAFTVAATFLSRTGTYESWGIVGPVAGFTALGLFVTDRYRISRRAHRRNGLRHAAQGTAAAIARSL